MFNRKIDEAIKRGGLVSHKRVLSLYSKKDRSLIEERTRYYIIQSELRKLRLRKKMTQEELARRMKVKPEFVSRIESGKQNITLETLFKIASATGTEFRMGFDIPSKMGIIEDSNKLSIENIVKNSETISRSQGYEMNGFAQAYLLSQDISSERTNTFFNQI